MLSRDITINNLYGIHARPSSMIAELSENFSSTITIKKNDSVANARSVMELILLSVAPGSVITLEIDGEDEQQALDAFVDLIEVRLFDEASKKEKH